MNMNTTFERHDSRQEIVATRSAGGEWVTYGSDSARRLLALHQLDSLDRLFDGGRGADARHAGRSVYHSDVVDAEGRRTRLFIKLQQGRRRLWPRMNDIKSGQVFQTLAEREWHGIERLRGLGLLVPEALGLFGTTRWALSFRAAVVVRQVPPPSSLDEMLSDGRWNDVAKSDRIAILDATVSALERIHAAGLGWRGSSSRHFFPERDGSGQWRVWLIDCEGVHRFAGAKTRARNYDKLVRAFRESGADESTLADLRARLEKTPQRSQRFAA